MKKQPAIEANSTEKTITVLAVSPDEHDHKSLEAIIRHSRWTLLKADRLPTARAMLQSSDVSVVLCETELESGSWTELLEYTKKMANPPSFIVASRLADDELWGRALNMDAWDVLAKPFDRGEVLRCIRLAWQHWHHQSELDEPELKVMRAS